MNDDAPLMFGLISEPSLRDFAAFTCGDEEWQIDLRDFLFEDALRQFRGRFNVTTLFYTQSREPVGFVTLSAAQVNRGDIDHMGRAPYAIVPAVLIGRIGVDLMHQNRGRGQQILAFVRAWTMALPIGCRVLALQVDVRNVGAIRFYEREGFTKAPIEPQRNMQWMFFDLEARPDED